MKGKVQLLICDLDNTLYDWMGYFVSSFYSMITKATEVLNCDQEKLLEDFKKVHQQHHDVEYPFALLETQTVLSLYPQATKQQLYEQLAPIFAEHKLAREKNLRLHPQVYETLEAIRNKNIKLIAHTEANLFSVTNRLERLNLTHFFEKIYCRERAKEPHPNGSPKSKKYFSFPYEKVTELSHHQRKPDITVLLEIISAAAIAPENVAYVGDSMARDILMAKKANVYAILAEYGSKRIRIYLMVW